MKISRMKKPKHKIEDKPQELKFFDLPMLAVIVCGVLLGLILFANYG